MLYLSLFWLTLYSCTVDAHTFTLYDNGASTGGVNVTISSSEFSAFGSNKQFARVMSEHIDVSKYGVQGKVFANKAYREDGERVVRYDQLAPEEGTAGELRRVYLVAQGLEFVWPFVSRGFIQQVSQNVLRGADEALPVTLESVADSPRVFRVFNMLTRQDAQAIIDNALSLTGDNAMKRSTVGNSKNRDDGSIQQDGGRTSENAWDHDSPTAKMLIERSFNLTRLKQDAGQQDGLQVVRYELGQGYNTHPDYFERNEELFDDFDFNPYSGGSNRFATVFMYLNDVEEGGFTVFPREPAQEPRDPPPGALEMFEEGSWEHTLTQQCYRTLAVPPLAATAALFYSSKPDGSMDPKSYHGACPVTRGVKWGCNIWLWNRQRFGETKTGASVPLRVTNKTPHRIYVAWEGKPSGEWAPGESSTIGTFEHHRFKAYWQPVDGKEKGAPLSEFTVQVGDRQQHWEIDTEDNSHDEL